jgi:transcriptional regulator with PAS, ATPase and Fis domain
VTNVDTFKQCLNGEIVILNQIKGPPELQKIVAYIPLYQKAELFGVLYLNRKIAKKKAFTKPEVEEIQQIFQPLYIYLGLYQHIECDLISGFMGIIGNSESMKDVYRKIILFSQYNEPVLITGPTGSGKELIADAIHRFSSRRDKVFRPENCAAFAPDLAEGTFLGYKKGAFTGADRDYAGIFEQADGGTIFLDEIGDLSFNLQSKLLRILQEKEVYRLGDKEARKTDFRLIAATNKNLEKMINEGTFREDLYYRISVLWIDVPPLEERKEDIELIAQAKINDFYRQYGIDKERLNITPKAIKMLKNHTWKGNVRELISTLYRSIIYHQDQEKLDCADIIFDKEDRMKNELTKLIISPSKVHKLDHLIFTYVDEVLKINNNDINKTMRQLGISRHYLNVITNKQSVFKGNKNNEDEIEKINLI